MPGDRWLTYTVDERQAFSDLVKGPRTPEQVASLGTSQNFLGGSIIWDRSIGRPRSEVMADGFTITASFETIIRTGDPAGGGPAIEKPVRTPLPVTAKWDARDDAGHRVTFVFSGLDLGRTYTVNVELAGHTEWDGELKGTWLREVKPSERSFTKEVPPVWLDPFTITVRPFIFI